jgi:uncharacterized membrane protein YdjX (TVP38/TMEM64 family)
VIQVVDYAEIAVNWIIKFVILYFILNLLEDLASWKFWVILMIALLVLFVLVDKLIEIYLKRKKLKGKVIL